MRRKTSFQIFLSVYLSIAATSAFAFEQRCGFEDCPVGFTNLFCRPIDNPTVSWTSEYRPPIDYSAQACVVKNGGPINVKGDLTFFFKLNKLPAGSSLIATVKAQIVARPVYGEPHSYIDTFSFGPYKNALPAKPADWYIVSPQLNFQQEAEFKANFRNAVEIYADFEFYADAPAQAKDDSCKSDWCSYADIIKTPPNKKAEDLYGGIKQMHR
jgi:hypothetical protein